MKFIAIIIVLLFSINTTKTFAQSAKDIATDSFSVQGNCEMCKKRIEDAAYTKGVKLAQWNESSKVLVLTYRPSKTNTDVILQQVAHAGHDNDKYKATDAEYKKVPECCAYKTAVCNHK